MVVEIDHETCTLCGGYAEPLCIDKCPDSALSLRDKRVEVTEFLCEDCNECGFICPVNAIKIKIVTF
jgi:MinD superfamily P-loop ATPase